MVPPECERHRGCGAIDCNEAVVNEESLYDPYCKTAGEMFVRAGLVELMASTAIASPSGHSSACVAAQLVAHGFKSPDVGATASETTVQIDSVRDWSAHGNPLPRSGEQSTRDCASHPT